MDEQVIHALEAILFGALGGMMCACAAILGSILGGRR